MTIFLAVLTSWILVGIAMMPSMGDWTGWLVGTSILCMAYVVYLDATKEIGEEMKTENQLTIEDVTNTYYANGNVVAFDTADYHIRQENFTRSKSVISIFNELQSDYEEPFDS